MAVYNSQLVARLTHAIDRLYYSADYGSEDAFELYHRIQEDDARRADAGAGGIGLPALGHALAGSAGTALSHLVLYPLDLVITRLQVQQQLKKPGEAPSAGSSADDAEYSSLADAARKIHRHEGGIAAFWNGCATDTAKGVIDSFLFFLAYTALRQRQQQKLGHKNLPVLSELGVGIAAGALSKFVTTPIQQVVTRKQTAALVAARDKTSSLPPGLAGNLSIKDIFLQIRSERGLRGFWAGYSASIILTLNPALTFLLQDLFRRLLPRSKRDKPGPNLLFLIAAVSKAAATCVTYPFSLAKSRAQVSSSSAEEKKQEQPEYLKKPDLTSSRPVHLIKRLHNIVVRHVSQLAVLRSLRTIYTTEGLGGLYSGLDADVVKGFLGHGLSMVLKERIHVLLISAYYLTLKALKKWPHHLGSVGEQAGKEFERAKDAAFVGAEDLKDRVVSVGGTVVEGVRDATLVSAEDIKDRVVNVKETVVEGVKNAVEGGKE